MRFFHKNNDTDPTTGEHNAIEANVTFDVNISGQPSDDTIRGFAEDYIGKSMNESVDSPFKMVSLLWSELEGSKLHALITVVKKGSPVDVEGTADALVNGTREANVHPDQSAEELQTVLDKVSKKLLLDYPGYDVQDIKVLSYGPAGDGLVRFMMEKQPA
jgi:hypothetical protein